MNSKGYPKSFKLKFTVQKNKNESKPHFKKRRADFYRVMTEMWEKNKTKTPPEVGDSYIR